MYIFFITRFNILKLFLFLFIVFYLCFLIWILNLDIGKHRKHWNDDNGMRMLIVRKKVCWEWVYKDLRDIWDVSWLNFPPINFLLTENICLSSEHTLYDTFNYSNCSQFSLKLKKKNSHLVINLISILLYYYLQLKSNN